MKQKIILAVVVAAVVLAAAFALHRPQAGTQPTPEPTRQAETNDAVPAEPTPQPAAVSAPAHAKAIIIALSILCLLLAIGVGVLLHQKHSENRELTFDEMESESIEDADIDEFQFG